MWGWICIHNWIISYGTAMWKDMMNGLDIPDKSNLLAIKARKEQIKHKRKSERKPSLMEHWFEHGKWAT